MRRVLHPGIVLVIMASLLAVFAAPARADECPGSEKSLTVVKNAISEFQRNDRAPAGADCAYTWAMNVELNAEGPPNDVIAFFKAATDVQRAAALKRYGAEITAEGDNYLDQEIELRQRFLQVLIKVTPTTAEQGRAVVEHLSYMVSALALRHKYETVADVLGETRAAVIDDEALKVWLRAVWSCANWDGIKTNLCIPENRQQCKNKIEIFLLSVDEMKGRSFPAQTRRDISGLKELSEGSCLQ